MITGRAVLRATGLYAACLLVAATAAEPLRAVAHEATPIRLVSQERLLRDAVIARRLQEAEQSMTEKLQAQIDQTKEALAEEEAELARLRAELPPEEFQARIANFDERMRMARQLTQERAAALQRGFQDARAIVAAAIPGVMERLRRETGATVILNADHALAADPALDLTERAVQLFDAVGPSPTIPDIDLRLPVSDFVTPVTSGDNGSTE